MDPDESVRTPEDQPAIGNVLDGASDPDGDTPLTVTDFTVVVDNQPIKVPAGGSITIPGVGEISIGSNGDYVFTPVDDYNGGVPPITYTISDGKGGTDTSTLTIEVTPIDDLPLAVADTNTIAEDAVSVSGTVITNDTLGDGTAAQNVVS
ncbi:MAG: Ig-like domain-containing protein, partial [Synechococcus sp.]